MRHFIYVFLVLCSMSVFAQEPKVIIDKEIKPGAKLKWTYCYSFKATAGMKFTVEANVKKAKKNITFCITSFPGNQFVYADYKTNSVKHTFVAPTDCEYAIMTKRKQPFQLKITQIATPEQEAKIKAEEYMLVNIPDTTWRLAIIDTIIGYETKVMPMTKKVKYQTKEATEIIYNKSFAISPENTDVASIELPFLMYDDYQKIRVTKLTHTLTVSDATYSALKSKVSDALVSGVTMGVGKAAQKKIGKLAEHDESFKTVQNLQKKMDKIEPYKETIMSGYDMADIAINGARPEEEEEEGMKITIPTYMFEGDKLNKKMMEATKSGGKVENFTNEEVKTIKVPGIGDVASGAAGLITPKIKDKVKFKITGLKDTLLHQGTSGFDVYTMPYKTQVTGHTYFYHIKNPRSRKDLKNLLTSYMYGSLMVEMTYEIDTYKDVLYFGEVRQPVYGKRLVNTPSVKYRTEYIRKRDMKPWYVKTKQQFIPAPDFF